MVNQPLVFRMRLASSQSLSTISKSSFCRTNRLEKPRETTSAVLRFMPPTPRSAISPNTEPCPRVTSTLLPSMPPKTQKIYTLGCQIFWKTCYIIILSNRVSGSNYHLKGKLILTSTFQNTGPKSLNKHFFINRRYPIQLT